MVCGCCGGRFITPRRYHITKNQCRVLKRVCHRFGFGQSELDRLFATFNDIEQRRHPGTIVLADYLNYFDVADTPFTRRTFEVLDADGNNQIDFMEFCCMVYAFGSHSWMNLCTWIFQIFDVDQSCELSMTEMKSVVSYVYGKSVPWAAAKVLANIADDSSASGTVSLQQFFHHARKYPVLLSPAFAFQEILRKKAVGSGFWQQQEYRLANSPRYKLPMGLGPVDVMLTLMREPSENRPVPNGIPVGGQSGQGGQGGQGRRLSEGGHLAGEGSAGKVATAATLRAQATASAVEQDTEVLVRKLAACQRLLARWDCASCRTKAAPRFHACLAAIGLGVAMGWVQLCRLARLVWLWLRRRCTRAFLCAALCCGRGDAEAERALRKPAIGEEEDAPWTGGREGGDPAAPAPTTGYRGPVTVAAAGAGHKKDVEHVGQDGEACEGNGGWLRVGFDGGAWDYFEPKSLRVRTCGGGGRRMSVAMVQPAAAGGRRMSQTLAQGVQAAATGVRRLSASLQGGWSLVKGSLSSLVSGAGGSQEQATQDPEAARQALRARRLADAATRTHTPEEVLSRRWAQDSEEHALAAWGKALGAGGNPNPTAAGLAPRGNSCVGEVGEAPEAAGGGGDPKPTAVKKRAQSVKLKRVKITPGIDPKLLAAAAAGGQGEGRASSGRLPKNNKRGELPALELRPLPPFLQKLQLDPERKPARGAPRESKQARKSKRKLFDARLALEKKEGELRRAREEAKAGQLYQQVRHERDLQAMKESLARQLQQMRGLQQRPGDERARRQKATERPKPRPKPAQAAPALAQGGGGKPPSRPLPEQDPLLATVLQQEAALRLQQHEAQPTAAVAVELPPADAAEEEAPGPGQGQAQAQAQGGGKEREFDEKGEFGGM
jgi:Ca2+-binding EF-hand superfamily protein